MRHRFYRWGNKLNENTVGTGIPCLLNSRVMLVKKNCQIYSKSYSEMQHCERKSKMHLFKSIAYLLERILE